MRIYGNLTRSEAVFNICCSCMCQKLQIPLMTLLLSPLLTLASLRTSVQRKALATLSCSTVIILELDVE